MSHQSVKILVINAGSTSVKFKLYDMDGVRRSDVLAEGNCQRVGSDSSELKYMRTGGDKIIVTKSLPDHSEAMKLIFQLLTSGGTKVVERIDEIGAIGHRVAMGGPRYRRTVRVDEEVIRELEELGDVTPLHNPPQTRVMRVCRDLLGEKFPMVVGFDTAFHATIPKVAQVLPGPYRYYEQYNLRRYGFHGLSHQYVVERYQAATGGSLEGTRIVTCHLGGGSSVTAIKDGRSVDNSFAFGSGKGVLGGTRAGDFDHIAIGYIMKKDNLTYEQVEDMLHRESGLLGISGITGDEWQLEGLAKEGNERAQLALDMMALQVKQYIGAYAFAMGGLDSLIFTGGIGENSDLMRAMICDGLEAFGILLDREANVAFNRREHRISASQSRVDVWSIPTNEEWVIARDAMELIFG